MTYWPPAKSINKFRVLRQAIADSLDDFLFCRFDLVGHNTERLPDMDAGSGTGHYRLYRAGTDP